MKKYDMIFIHAPSIFDFRNRDDILFAFSSSSNISVSLIYEIFPLGLKTIETFLKQQGKQARIVNLAEMMLKDSEMNVEAFLKTLNAKMFGIDLHWLAHTQGSLAVAKLLKKLHPDIPITFGGISASYFYDELIGYPQVDFIIRGVNTPQLLDKLLEQLDSDNHDDILNLCWKDKENNVVINDFSRTVEFNNTVDWTHSDKDINFYMLFSGAGCEYSCTFCSGARYSMNKHFGVETGFASKKQALFLKELESIKNHTSRNSTIITLHHWFEDIHLLEQVLNTIKLSNIKTVHFTIFELISNAHIELITESKIKPYFEISIQSSSEKIRRLCGNPSYSNEALEKWLDNLFVQNKEAFVSIFLMIGLPEQTEEDVMKDIRYSEYLMNKYQEYKFNVFISPMRPFLDPGSMIFDNPEKFGYKIFFNTLKDYEKAMLVPHWKDSLNYETKWMSKSDIVDITYRATREMVLAKERCHKMPHAISKYVLEKIDSTVELLNNIKKYDNNNLPQEVKKKILEYNNDMFQSSISHQSPLNFSIYKFWYQIEY